MHGIPIEFVVACWTISALIASSARRWIAAGWCACFALFTVLDRMTPADDGGPFKYVFLALGFVLIGAQVARRYARYKKGDPAPRPKSR